MPPGHPQPPRSPLTQRRDYRTQINSMTDLNEYSPLLAEIDRVCRLQDIPTTSALAEYGPGQYEVNLQPRPGCTARLRRSAALQARGEVRGACLGL